MLVKFPTIHLNGTNRDDLLEALEQAHEAVRLAQEKLALCGPNARDYYPQEEGAFYVAQEEHSDRMRKLTDVRRELEEQAEHLALGPDNFGRRA